MDLPERAIDVPMSVYDLPLEVEDTIRYILHRSSGRPPTDHEVLQTYDQIHAERGAVKSRNDVSTIMYRDIAAAQETDKARKLIMELLDITRKDIEAMERSYQRAVTLDDYRRLKEGHDLDVQYASYKPSTIETRMMDVYRYVSKLLNGKSVYIF